MGLIFNGWDARANGVSQLKSISGQNTISSAVAQEVTNGFQPANITTTYKGTLDFKSTYYGCAILTGASAGLEQECTLNFVGIKIMGGSVAVSATFNGTALAAKPLAFVDFQGKLDGVVAVQVYPVKSETVSDLQDPTRTIRQSHADPKSP